MADVRRRAALVAPGSDDRKACKALASTADEVVLDLEDAVATGSKVTARTLVSDLIREHGTARTVSVRINGPTTPWFTEDLRACAALAGTLTSIVVPKVESRAELAEADAVLTAAGAAELPVQALIETPAGIGAVDDIATGPRVSALIIGYADLGAALGRAATAGPQQWLFVQDRVLHAARAAGIQAVDGPYLRIADDADFRAATGWTADLGFDGKWVIHPAQIATVQEVFTPTEQQAEYARRVLAALEQAESHGAGAAQLDGQMLDEAVAVAARRTLSKIGA
ncbi:HpcH/HpaI aldolase/citrate lyase family protein [Nocardia vermiculata]|uniref:CoA ester lyase n=1 Tax=Nocardia vermiculata TaxID=257274 RepID=A0A846Y0X5_9NOCA|nr:CoA ester lyase [Nocardia vermiculata]NKY51650.1 CoA ester lyase [Nocardia vermiculata]